LGVVAGSALSPTLLDGFARHGVQLVQSWGGTELSPMGSVATAPPGSADAQSERSIRLSQGRAPPLIEHRLADDDGKLLPWDGRAIGEIQARGPWVAASYYTPFDEPEGADRFTADGWYSTGDLGSIDARGDIRLCDRRKDVIKSGGEWISSIELENALMTHPAVQDAAVFAGAHPHWVERPIAAVVLKAGASAKGEDLTAHLEGRFAKFWLPDVFLFVAEVPRTSTGKYDKRKLREMFGDALVRERPPEHRA
jgi:fatty-acyl-CoA synthase